MLFVTGDSPGLQSEGVALIGLPLLLPPWPGERGRRRDGALHASVGAQDEMLTQLGTPRLPPASEQMVLLHGAGKNTEETAWATAYKFGQI